MPLVTSELVRLTLTEERYEPSFARVPETWAELTGLAVSIWKVVVRAASSFPARSVAAPACHEAASQLSTTARSPKIRSMSRAQGTSRLAGLIVKFQAAPNSSSTFPEGLYSVATA